MLSLCIHFVKAQMTVRVDERFELTSITFALAGVPEFCESRVSTYWQDVKKEFASYERTEPINFVRKLNQKYNIGYNAVANIVTFLEIKQGEIVLQDDIPNLTDIDPRWNKKLLIEYVGMLNSFYKESSFNSFFYNHKWLYDITEQRMNEYLRNIQVNEWLNLFFRGDMNQNLNIYVSLINGPHNYAFSDGVIVGVAGDEKGMPVPNLSTIPIFIHEVLHHYTNPLFFTFWNEMKNGAEKIYSHINNQMNMIGYGNSKTMALEWLNNLFVLMYLQYMNYESVEFILTQNMEKGFIWMERSMDFMNNFLLSKKYYSSINDFMPQLIAFFNGVANDFELIVKEYENLHPYIKNVFPVPGSSLRGIDKIVVTFSEPMNGSFGFVGIPLGCDPLPVDFNNIKWSDDKCHFIMNLESELKNSDCKFGIKLNPNAFQSLKYYKLGNDVDCDIVY